jgi:hypothetical protein
MAYFRRALAGAALTVIAACGQASSGGTGGSIATNCQPGATGACTCPNLSIGLQTCNAEGSAFGTCVCGDGGPSGNGGGGGGGGQADGGADASDAGPVLTPQTLVSQQAGLKDIAIDATYVYWTAASAGVVAACPLTGCGAPTVLASGEPYPLGVATSGGQAYWSDYGLPGDGGTVVGGGVGSSTVGSGDGKILVGNEIHAGPIAADPNNIYWSAAGQVSMCDPQSCAPAGVAVDTAQAIAVDAASIYWTSAVTGAVLKNVIGNDAGSVQTITPAGYQGENLRGLVVSGGNVYWATPDQVFSCPSSGCTAAPAALAANQGIVGLQHPLAADGAYLYWANGTTVVRCAIPGGCNGTPEVIADGQIAPTAVAVSATTVYWIDGANILSLAKPM